jgi:hypothetical protein
VAAYEEALELDPTLAPSAAAWSTLCQNGALGGHPGAVLEACDRGMELAPGNPGLQNARGLARALTGDLDGARSDFEARLDASWIASAAQRQEWIDALGRGENPLTPAVLERLRGH